MNTRIDHIPVEALGRPTNERSFLVVALMDSREGGGDSFTPEAWRQELRRRQAALHAGAIKPIPWAEAKARLNAPQRVLK